MSWPHAKTVCPEERLLWYDALPYLGLSRAAERRLLADQTTMALTSDTDSKIAARLVRADALAASGRMLESLTEVTRVYDAGRQGPLRISNHQ